MNLNFVKVNIVAVLLLLPMIGGCCRPIESTPTRPNQVRGWQKLQTPQFKAIGEFVLKTGESVDNHTVGIGLIKVIPGKNCRGTESTGPSVVVRFFRASDKQTILEIELTGANTRLISFNRPLVEEYGISTIAIRAINTKEGWMWFELWS